MGLRIFQSDAIVGKGFVYFIFRGIYLEKTATRDITALRSIYTYEWAEYQITTA